MQELFGNPKLHGLEVSAEQPVDVMLNYSRMSMLALVITFLISFSIVMSLMVLG